jgi:hypothetical protein
MMATTKLKFWKHVMRNLRPNRKHNSTPVVETVWLSGATRTSEWREARLPAITL